ncbi:MAG: prolipoprotein diacylglyceryl transferase [Faecalibacterium sp.]|jgi:phosphatidylglycerol:prolipoprotein diacylglycerol transferase|nr:prolipoprotein diacylglyceryl transferase [Faecalibacterium sp.]
MLPQIEWFGRIIPTYGLLAAAAAAAALCWIFFRSPALGLSRENSVYIAAFGGVGALLGAKALYLLLALPELWRDLPLLRTAPQAFWARYVTGGMVFYGGLLGALLGMRWAAGQYRVRLRDYCSVLIPAVALAHGIARIGCFCAGCCYGVENARFGIAFSVSPVAPNGIKLLPVQLIEAAAEGLIFLALVWFTAKPARRPYTLCTYLLLYAPVRFCLEFWRGDVARGIWLGLSTSQWISGVVMAGALFWAAGRLRQAKQQPQNEKTEKS